MHKKRELDEMISKIGELEDEEEKILGEAVAEAFYKTRKIDPNWDESTKKKIIELEKQIDLLMDEIDKTSIPKPSKSALKRFVKEIIDAEDLSLLANGADEILKDIFNKVKLELSYEETKKALQETLIETGDEELKIILKTLDDKRGDIEDWLKKERDMR